MQAIEYAQKNLVNNDDDERLQETLVLLAFKPDTDCEKYEVSKSLKKSRAFYILLS